MRPCCVAMLCVLAIGCELDTGGDAVSAADAAAGEPDTTTTPLQADVVAVAVVGAPLKGDPVSVVVTVHNAGTTPGRVRVEPRLTTEAFTDFTDVPFGAADVDLGSLETAEVTLVAGPFLDDDARGKRYALGRGAYRIDAVHVDGAADTEFDGGTFDVGDSNAVFNAVVYDPAYLERIGYSGSAEQYMRESFTRHAQLFDDSAFTDYPGGFDAMMDVTQHFRAVDGLTASNDAGGFCEQIGAYARTAFGLTRDWDIDENAGGPDLDHHGFDLLVGLTPAMGGGAACGWLGVQVSGLFDFDLSLDRSQIIVVHETGHLFGAPHCDPMQGYVMCSGEQHERYQSDGIFVWHRVSRDAMSNRWR